MLDLELIVNVVVGIFVYKSIGAIIEFSLLKILATLIGSKVNKQNYKEKSEEFLKRNSN